MTKFEYKTVIFSPKGNWSMKFDQELIDKTLNDLGAEGWELVSVQDITWSGTIWSLNYTFKRLL